MDVNYNDYDEVQQYIDDYDIPFTEWIKNPLIHLDFIYKWIEKWEEVPILVYSCLAERKDAYYFYTYNKFSNNPKDFFKLLNHQLNSIYFHSHLEIIKKYLDIPEFFKYFKYPFLYGLKNGIHIYPQEFQYNLLSLLIYIKYNNKFLVFLDKIIINNLDYLDKTKNDNLKIPQNIIDYLEYLIEKEKLKKNNYNVLEIFLDILLNCNIKKNYSYFLSNIFNKHIDKINIYNKEQILKYIYNSLKTNNNTYILTDRKSIIQSVDNLDVNAIISVYLDSEDNDIKLIIVAFLIIIKRINDECNIFFYPKFIYKFIKQLNDSLENFLRFSKIFGSYINKDELTEDEEEIAIEYKNLITDTITQLNYFYNIIKLEKDNNESVFLLPEIIRYLTTTIIIHIKNINSKKDKYSYLSLYITDYNIQNIIDILLYIYKYYGLICVKPCAPELAMRYTKYGNNKEIIQKIINSISREHYEYLISLINNDENLDIYKKINRIELDYPMDLLDQISMEPLDDLVELPSKNIVNRETILLHLYDNENDPFTRQELTISGLEYYNSKLEVLERTAKIKSKIDKFREENIKN